MTKKVDVQMSAVTPFMKEKWHERRVFSVSWPFSDRVWEGAVGGSELPQQQSLVPSGMLREGC